MPLVETMTPRERVMKALNREPVDRTKAEIRSSPFELPETGAA